MSHSLTFGHCAEDIALTCAEQDVWEAFALIHIARMGDIHEVLVVSELELIDWMDCNHVGYVSGRDGTRYGCTYFEEPYYVEYL